VANERPQRPGRIASDRQARKRWPVIGLAVVVLVLVAVVAFLIVDDSSGDNATPVTTTTTVPTTTTTVPTSTTPTTTAPLPTTPEGYAQTLFTAWQANNRALAGEVASATAVTQMFAQPFPTGPTNPYSYQGCQGAAGSVVCTWQGNGQVIVMTVRNLTGGLPIQVETVQVQAKN
jgi:hypothetical protein